jgi:hypothetical protein
MRMSKGDPITVKYEELILLRELEVALLRWTSKE